MLFTDQGDLELSSKDESEQADRTSKVPVFLWNSILLKHFAPLTRGSICPTISFNEIGELIFGCSENVLLSERKTYTWREPKEIKFPGKTVRCVAQHRMYIYALLSDGVVHQILQDPVIRSYETKQVFSISKTYEYPQMDVSSEYLVVSTGKNRLTAHNLISNSRRNLSITNVGCIGSLCFDSDGTLLVLDSSNGTVNKFHIGVDSHLLLWTCQDVKGALSICTDTSLSSRHILAYRPGELIFIDEGQCADILVEQ